MQPRTNFSIQGSGTRSANRHHRSRQRHMLKPQPPIQSRIRPQAISTMARVPACSS